MKVKITTGDELRIKAIRRAIKKVGTYEKQVSVWINKSSGRVIIYSASVVGKCFQMQPQTPMRNRWANFFTSH